MYHTHSLVLKVLLPVLLAAGLIFPLLAVQVPWYVYWLVVPVGAALGLALIGKLLLVLEAGRAQTKRPCWDQPEGKEVPDQATSGDR